MTVSGGGDDLNDLLGKMQGFQERLAASEAAGDGGMGTPNGITSDMDELSRSRRCTRKSWSKSAVSLGAGGHLNGVEVTPTMTRPPSKLAKTSRRAKAPATV